MRWFWSLLAMLLLVPGWTGEPRLPLIAPGAPLSARAITPAGGWPARMGAVAPVGALSLESSDRDVGGFSALALRGDEAVLLSDGGQLLRLHIAGRHLERRAIVTLRDGPGTGWMKLDRDTESLVLDRATGAAWIGYERVNAIWRYAPDLEHAEAFVAPPAMRDWGENTGPESLVQLNDGRFLVIQEGWRNMREPRAALLFSGDPTAPRRTGALLHYRPPNGFAPSDATVLPNGDVLVLNRRWHFPPLRFDSVLVRIARESIQPGAMLSGPIVADISAAVAHENAEGLAIAVERGQTFLWVVTDNDTARWRPTVLAKFRWLG
ncbi:esterase-like activity of phytase family protein [Sphingomonas sp. DT-51]|uniref:esterase-like activity of phytase family protein n=1 Tax=Sphingomonas sp. DT-51 TaxID=3396165 RepID=UPI003F1DD372